MQKNTWKLNREQCLKCGKCIRDCIVECLVPDPDGYPVLPAHNAPYCLHCQHCFAVCPAGAVTIDHAARGTTPQPGPLPSPDEMANLLRQRRSIRVYKPDLIPDEILNEAKDLLRYSPTGCNDHRLHFRILQGEELAEFRVETAKMLRLLIRTGIMRLIYPNYKRYLNEILSGKDVIYRDAPYAIVVSTPKNAPCKEADPWIALSYLDLYFQSRNIGTCWCGFALYSYLFPKLRKKLNLPKGYKPGAVLLFGYPAVTYPAVPDPAPVKIV